MIFRYIVLLLTLVFSSEFRSRASATFLSNVTDQQALRSVRDSITADPLGLLSSWNDNVTFCTWKGVTCSRRHQRVTALNLSSQQMVGTLSPHIGNLSFLRLISLNRNEFRGPIPGEIGKLFRLQYLYLGNNFFEGEFPMNLSHCLEVKHIHVEVNNLGGNLPTDFTSWSKLTIFNATKNHFTGVIPASIGNISSLLALDLFQNNLTGSIPFEISHNSKMENLNLGDNKLSMVPPQLFNMSSLSIVDLAANELEGWIPADLGFTLPNLVLFFAEVNKLSGAFPLSITNASNLVGFDLSNSDNITGPLPMNFGSLSRLKFLGAAGINLGHNKQPGGLSFLNSLANCSRLKFLYIDDSGLSGKLPNSIGNLSTRLDTLYIGGNYIYGGVPQEIGNLFNLTRLTLNMNMLTGTIPKSICKLSKLGYLSIGGNNISGTIPNCISNISELYLLDVSENMLYGSIPNVLFNTSSLHALYLYDNHLNGEIPEQITGLSLQIVIVALSQNHLTGSLPSNIGSLKLLNQLDVSHNKFTGEIPTTLGDCLMLEKLYMEGNLFEGGIPSSFQVLKGLVILDLSNNNVTGKIPNFFGGLHIEFLNLSHNKLEGEVPKNGMFSNSSAFSVAGNFQLCGGIPALKLPACPAKITGTKNKKFPLKIIPLVVLLPLATLITCFIFCFYRIKNSKQKDTEILVLHDHPYPRLSYHDLLLVTTNFSPENLLGEGRYGSVYKGVLQSRIVAVKVLKADVHGAKRTFLAECETLRTIRHRNLVKIITTCDSTDYKGNEFRALVFEFMANGSVENWLHPSDQGKERNLTLFQRLNIAIDVALAVDYLHHHGPSKIIHCDIKPSNILLDEELVARVSDFGLARIFLNDTGDISHPQTSSTCVRGTVGYVPPEYGMGGKISAEGDVYSYGILLLEMFSGKRPTSSSILMDHTNNLHDYVRNALPQRVMEIVDPRIRPRKDDCASMEIFFASVFEVGVLCCVETPGERIDMSVATKKLHLAKERLVGRGWESESLSFMSCVCLFIHSML